jgi:KilA-N domain
MEGLNKKTDSPMAKINVKNTSVVVVSMNDADYISLTDIAKYKTDNTSAVIANWMRNRNTIEFLGIWETLYNPKFKPLEFEGFKKEAGLNAFTMSALKWINATNAVGFAVKPGRYGGTFAHKDIAFKFASWISVEFELYIVKEFQRLKEEEQKQIGWSAKRELAKLNYHIHTDAIKQNLIPKKLSALQTSIVYASEADVLNIALFGITAKQWRDANPSLKGNMRDYAGINELICLSNMENINAVFINEGLPQMERLVKLNAIAIQQMKILVEVENRKLLK